MKVYLSAGRSIGQGIQRVARELAKHAPDSVKVVDDPESADFRIWHALGPGERPAIMAETKPFAMIQYCYLTSNYTDPLSAWLSCWMKAKAVWSYYPTLPFRDAYIAPLGVDTDVFTPCGCGPQFLVGTSGYIAETECVDLWHDVVRERQAGQFHLGPNLNLGHDVYSLNNIPDAKLAAQWGKCQYVSGLRVVEGFELPAYEGLACGARPVMFQRPDAVHWLSDHAEYIVESHDRDAMRDQIRAIVAKGPRRVTPAEIEWVRARFQWKPLVEGFWERILS